MPRKKQKANSNPPSSSDTAHSCHVPGCLAPGEYKAPRSRHSLTEYDWYCLEHVRAHNEKWDFFTGMDRRQIEQFMRDAVTGHRPTWKREDNTVDSFETLQAALDKFLHFSSQQRKEKSDLERSLNGKLREALATFDIEYPYTEKELKRCYRALVKKFHPDANKGARNAEEKFKEITVAYLLLNKHLQDQSM